MLLMTSHHPQRKRRSRARVLGAFIAAQRRALTGDGAKGTPPQMPSPAFSTRSRAAIVAFTPNSHRRPDFLLAADSTDVHPQQPVNISIFAVIGCTALIPDTFPPGNFRLLYSSHLGVTCRPPTRCRRQRDFRSAHPKLLEDRQTHHRGPRGGLW